MKDLIEHGIVQTNVIKGERVRYKLCCTQEFLKENEAKFKASFRHSNNGQDVDMMEG